MDEDRVEHATETDAAHVADNVLALRIQACAHLEHVRRAIYEREAEVRLQMGGVVAAPAAQLEHLVRGGHSFEDELTVELCLLGVSPPAP